VSRQALGKGIRAIIPEQTQQELENEARVLRLEEIRPNPFQPRQQAELEDLTELVASIRDKGVLQPVVVRRRRDGYELVMGERRFRAARQAGLETIPAVVRRATDAEMLELALVENVQRKNLNPIDEALAYRRLADEFKLTHEDIARRVGKDRSTVTNALRLLALPYKVRDLLAAGRLSAGHARALLGLASRRSQVDLAERIAADGLSVRAVERLCGGTRPARKRTEPDVHVRELQDRLQERLGTRVQISERGKGAGRVVIVYHGAEDLERIVRLIRGSS
jgi:ParB family chromosome partitioning protein